MKLGQSHLGKIIGDFLEGPNPLQERYKKEWVIWNAYFDALDKVEEGLNRGDPFAVQLREKAKNLIGWRPEVGLEEGIEKTIKWLETIRGR